MKRILRLFAFLILIIFSFYSCSAVSTGESEKKREFAEEMKYVYSLNNNKIFDTNIISCFSLIDTYKDGFVFTGMRYSPSEKFTVKNINGENIITEEFCIDEKNISVNNIQSYKDEVIVLSSYDSIYSVIVFGKDGKERRRLDLDFYPRDIKVINDSIYLLDYLNNAVHQYSVNLEFVSDYKINTDYDEIRYSPKSIQVSTDNTVYCLLENKITDELKMQRLGSQLEIIESRIKDMDLISNIFPDNNGNIVVAGKNFSDEEKFMIDIINSDGNILDMYEINECDEIQGITISGDIIYTFMSGVYSYSDGNSKYLCDYDSTELYDISISDNNVSLFLSSVQTCVDSVFIVDENHNITGEIYTGPINDAVVYNDIIYYSYQDINGSGVRYIKDNMVFDTDIFLDGSSIYRIAAIDDKKLAVYNIGEDGAESLILFDEQGNIINERKQKHNVRDIMCFNNRIFSFECNRICSWNSDLNDESIVSESVNLGDDFNCVRGNSLYDLFFFSDDCVLGYTIENDTVVLISKLSDIMPDSEINSILMTENNQLIINETFGIYLANPVEKLNNEENTQQTVLKLACFDKNLEISGLVNKYNVQNQEYNIEIIDYSNSNSEGDGINKFDADILNGDIPDIIMFSESINIPAYIRENLFSDLNRFIENDLEITSGMLNDNIIEAFEADGKLYFMPVSYVLQTITSSYEHSENEFSEYMNKLLEYDAPLVLSSGSQIFYDIITVYIDELDISANNFNLEETDFIPLIKFFRKYMEQVGNSKYLFVSDYEEKTHLFPVEYGDFQSFCMNIGYEAYDEYDVGYSLSISGTVYPKIGLSISARSEEKEKAWDFIKYAVNTSLASDKYDSPSFRITDQFDKVTDLSEASPKNLEKYNKLSTGSWLNIYYNYDIEKIIYNELFTDSEISEEERSREIYNVLKKYYYEIN